jgi:segregation and condensation protein A
MAEYKVQFEVFEGPLDLLLYLVKKEEVDIYQVNLTKIASEFIEYIEVMRQLDLEVAGEFLVMASTLMFIKSRELLPRDQQAAVEEDEDGEDPRWELIRQLVEYKKFKDAAAQLQNRECEQDRVYPRVPPPPEFELPPPARPNVSLFDLIHAVSSILKRFQQRDTTRQVFADRWTVSEKIEHLRQVVADRERLRFSELFDEVTSRSEVVVTFLALLELVRLRHLAVVQEGVFGDIQILRAPEEALSPAPESDTPASEPPAAAAVVITATAPPHPGNGSMAKTRLGSDLTPGSPSLTA